MMTASTLGVVRLFTVAVSYLYKLTAPITYIVDYLKPFKHNYSFVVNHVGFMMNNARNRSKARHGNQGGTVQAKMAAAAARAPQPLSPNAAPIGQLAQAKKPLAGSALSRPPPKAPAPLSANAAPLSSQAAAQPMRRILGKIFERMTPKPGPFNSPPGQQLKKQLRENAKEWANEQVDKFEGRCPHGKPLSVGCWECEREYGF